MSKVIQMIGKIKDNPNWQTHFQLASDLLIEAWKRHNIDEPLHVLNPSVWSMDEHLKNLEELSSLVSKLSATYGLPVKYDQEALYVAYSILNLISFADGVYILPNVATSLGSGAEIMVARRLKLPPIILLPIKEAALRETLQAYAMLKITTPDIKLQFEPFSNRIIVDSKPVPNTVDVTDLANGITKETVQSAIADDSINSLIDNILNQVFYFNYNPNHISYLFLWRGSEIFEEPISSEELQG